MRTVYIFVRDDEFIPIHKSRVRGRIRSSVQGCVHGSQSTLEPKFQLRLNLSRGNEVRLEKIELPEANVSYQMLTLVNQLQVL